ncbi:MATE family efflux transporter [Vibrio mimicus]|uniref:MATE family efflux transporter n=1 Tax=Vibrio mimicus TaxID=674 RepID=UPI002F940608
MQNEATIGRKFFSYVIPSVIAMLVSGLYQVIDGYFIGQYVGAYGLAAINLSWPLIGLIYGFGMMIGIGGGALSSISKGEGDTDDSYLKIGNAITLLLLIGIIVGIVAYFSGYWLLKLQGGEGITLILAEDYLNVIFFGAPICMGGVALPFLIRNDDRPIKATIIIAIGAVLNVILDWLFVANLNMSMTGAALATVFSQLVIVVISLIHFYSRIKKMKVLFQNLILDYEITKQICSVGFSSVIMYTYIGFVVAIHNYLFIHYTNVVYVAAYAIVGYITSLYFLFSEGIVSGSQPLISYEYGRKNIKNMQKVVNYMFSFAVGSGIVVTLLVYIYSSSVVRFFNHSDLELLEVTIVGLKLHLIGLSLDGLIFSAGVFFQSLGNGNRASLIAMLNMILQIPFVICLPILYGVKGIWLAVPVSNLFVSLICIFFLTKEWRKLKAILLNPNKEPSEYKLSNS